MELVFTILLTLHFATATDWGAKSIRLPQDRSRLCFNLYIPTKSSSINILSAKLVWIPKLKEFPNAKGRQAILLTLKTKSGDIVDVIESPSGNLGYIANIDQILSQGYLPKELAIGEHWYRSELGSTSICLMSKSLKVDDLLSIKVQLQLLK